MRCYKFDLKGMGEMRQRLKPLRSAALTKKKTTASKMYCGGYYFKTNSLEGLLRRRLQNEVTRKSHDQHGS